MKLLVSLEILNSSLKLKNIMQVPRLDKIVLNIGCGRASQDKSIIEDNIALIYRHKVSNKRRFKIVLNDGKKVIVTEDHSVMVLRDGELISVKPAEILLSDCCITV
jgi:intein/homing endonuclease